MIPTTQTPSPSPAPDKPPRRRLLDTSFYGLGPDDRLITRLEVTALTGYGSTSIYAKIKLGIFPKPVKPGMADSSRWVLGEIRKFNADAIAARDRACESVRAASGACATASPA
jgi:predicted DNA-binding transcriptional regulator AlpA